MNERDDPLWHYVNNRLPGPHVPDSSDGGASRLTLSVGPSPLSFNRSQNASILLKA